MHKTWESDMGKVVFSTPKTVEISLPHILTITNAVFFPAPVFVTLFNPFKTLNEVNFGNPINVAVTYDSGPGFSYNDLLHSLLAMPIEVGITRISSTTQAQASTPLYQLRNIGIGEFEGKTRYPLTYPNQFIRTITYLQERYVIDGFTAINYSQRHTDTQVKIYFYSEKSFDLSRAMSKEKVVESYGRPQTAF